MMIIATHNQSKYKEFKELLSPLGIKITSLSALGCDFEIEETGATFAENAILKAESICKLYQCDVIADDSGLEIVALDNFPGIESARFLGHHTDYRIKNARILEMLKLKEDRTAFFICAIAYARVNQPTKIFVHCLSGEIAQEPRGTNGFGYDPIFFMKKYQKTFAELTDLEKNTISHRAVATHMFMEYLKSNQ